MTTNIKIARDTMEKNEMCAQIGNMQSGGVILKIITVGRMHFIKMRCVPKLVTWLHHFHIVPHKGSNYAQNYLYIYMGGEFHA